MSVKLLCLDSSRESQSVTLCDLTDGSILATKSISESDPNLQKDTRQQKSSQYLPLLTDLFDELKLEPSDIDLIAVGIGPGSFTGVRTAITIAKTLGSQLNKKILALNNFELMRFEKNISDNEPVTLSAGKKAFFISKDNNYYSDTNFFSEESEHEVMTFGEINLSLLIANYVISKDDEVLSSFVNQSEVHPYYLREPTIGKIHPKKLAVIK